MDHEWINDLTDEQIQQMATEMQDLQAKEFQSEEEILEYFKEKFGKKRFKLKDRRPKDVRAEKDPYYHMLKDENQSIEFATDPSSPDMLMADLNSVHALHDILERNIARYP